MTTDSSPGQTLQFPAERDLRCPFDPPAQIIERAASKPVARVRIWDGSTPWLITGNEELRALASDPRISVNHHLPGFPHWNAGLASIAGKRAKTIMTADGEEHIRLRRMATGSFSVRRVDALRPAIQQVVDQQIDAMLNGPKPADLVPLLALPVPSMMICDLLGVPYEDHEIFEAAARAGLNRDATPESQAKTIGAMSGYMAGLFAKAAAGDGVVGVIGDYAGYVAAGEMTADEAMDMCRALLFAGHETSANMIGLGVLAALQYPDQLAILRDTDDPKVIANAVEELLRYLAIIHAGQRRIAVSDIEIAGETIRAGEGVILDFSGGNWDARVFPEPERLDLRRPASQHLAFGFGPHSCVGQQLARAELQIVFGTLFRRVPDLALAIPIEEIEFKTDRLAYGVYSLPVTW